LRSEAILAIVRRIIASREGWAEPRMAPSGSAGTGLRPMVRLPVRSPNRINWDTVKRRRVQGGSSRMRTAPIAVAFAVMVGSVAGAAAQSDYPRRPITLIVPFAAGGPTDVVARIVAEPMSRTLGQQIVVENIVGAGGTTASTRAMRANPDGYTIEMGHMGTHAAAVALYPSLAYKPDVDFAPISMV